MRRKNTVFAFSVTLLFFLGVFFTLSFFVIKPSVLRYVESLITTTINRDSDIKISVGHLDRHFLSYIDIKNLRIDYREDRVFNSDEIHVSVGIPSVFKFLKGKKAGKITVAVRNADLNLTQSVADYLENRGNGRNVESKVPDDGLRSETDFLELISNLSINLIVRDLTFEAEANGNRLSSSDRISLVADIDENLTLKKINCVIPALNGYLAAFESDLTAADIIFSTNSRDEILVNVGTVNIEKNLSAGNFRVKASVREGLLDGIASVDTGEFSYNGASVSVNTADFSFSADISDLRKTFKISSETKLIDVGYRDISLSLDELSADASYNLSGNSVNFSVFVKEMKSETFSSFGLKKASFNGFLSEMELNEDKSGNIKIHSFVTGASTVQSVGDFKSELNLSASFKDVSDFSRDNFSDIAVKLDNFSVSSMKGNNSVELNLKNGKSLDVSANFKKGLNGTAFYDFESKKADVKFYFKDFGIHDFIPLTDVLPSRLEKFTDDKTKLNGSFVLNAFLDPDNLNGRVSVNMALDDILIGNSRTVAATTLEANAEDGLINISSFALSGLGMRLSYEGSLYAGKWFPQGMLLLRKTATGAEIGRITFNLDSDLMGYTVNGFLTDKPQDSLFAHVRWNKDSDISGTAEFTTRYGKYDFSLAYDGTQKFLSMKSGASYAELKLNGEDIDVIFSLKDFAVHVSENVIMKLNADINGTYNTFRRTFSYKCENFEFVVSDILRFGFDFIVTQNVFLMYNLYVNAKGEELVFEGQAEFKYDSPALIFAGITETFAANVNFVRKNSDDYFRLSINSDKYALQTSMNFIVPVYVSLLGSRGNGFFADCRLFRTVFEARYRGKKVTFYNGSGKIGFLNLDRFDFTLDFVKRTLYGDMTLSRILNRKTGEVKQGCVVGISAKLDSVALGALSLAGLDASASFDMSIRNAFLGDDYSLPDTNIELTLNNREIFLNGKEISGLFDLSERYVDLTVSPDYMVGMHVTGYIKDELDLYLTDIHVPLKIIDRFSDIPFYSTKNGLLEGKLLVKGSVYDPSFYGSMYVSNLEIGLFFLPEQTLYAKDLIISAHDHIVSIADTKIIGSGVLDGRFYNANLEAEVELKDLLLQNFYLSLKIPDNPIDLWLPVNSKKKPVNVRGDVKGVLEFKVTNGDMLLVADIVADNTSVSFKIDDKPSWMDNMKAACSADVTLTTGKSVEFYYPSKDNSFMNFTVKEGESAHIIYDNQTKALSGEGKIAIKSGRISYINNDFNITEGDVRFSKPAFSDYMDMSLNLTAKLREYDSNGQRIDIILLLKNADLNNINPRFESIPFKTENEIINILGQSVIPGADEDVSLSSLANAAAVAADTISSLGIINTGTRDRLGHVIRDSLSLDTLSFRSPLIHNIIVNAMPGISNHSSLLAKYLNGTSLFAGKYLNDTLFLKMTLLLKQAGVKRRTYNYGHFISEDLNLDMEISIDWDNPMGSFTVFMQPQELFVLNFLYTIGFGVTKRIQF